MILNVLFIIVLVVLIIKLKFKSLYEQTDPITGDILDKMEKEKLG